MARITALVTVYHGTDAHDLERALDSLRAQTRPADEQVLKSGYGRYLIDAARD